MIGRAFLVKVEVVNFTFMNIAIPEHLACAIVTPNFVSL